MMKEIVVISSALSNACVTQKLTPIGGGLRQSRIFQLLRTQTYIHKLYPCCSSVCFRFSGHIQILRILLGGKTSRQFLLFLVSNSILVSSLDFILYPSRIKSFNQQKWLSLILKRTNLTKSSLPPSEIFPPSSKNFLTRLRPPVPLLVTIVSLVLKTRLTIAGIGTMSGLFVWRAQRMKRDVRTWGILRWRSVLPSGLISGMMRGMKEFTLESRLIKYCSY